MSSNRHTDFIDRDLQAPRVPRPDFQAEEDEAREKLGQMNRQRAQLEEEVADTARELHSLQQQQENLLKRKQTLETLRQQQQVYVTEKQDLARRVHQCLLLLDKEEVRVSQMQELYRNSRELFTRLESQLKDLAEGGWEEDQFDHELSHCTDVVKGVRMEFKKALARLDALDWNSDAEEGGAGEIAFTELGFGAWLKIGVAVALPLCLFGGFTALLVHWLLTKMP